jgi:hypothetical protein
MTQILVQEPSYVPEKVSWYVEFANNLVFKLEVQEGLARGGHDNVQKANMQAQDLMDDWINNLKLTNEKLGTLVLTLDTTVLELEKLDEIEGGRDELQKAVERLQKRVDYQNCQIEDYHELTKEEKVKFEKVCQDFEILSNRVLGEEKKIFFA